MKPALPTLLLGAAALALAACDDPFDVDAQFPVNADTLAVVALNNTQGSFYNGIRIVTVDADNKIGPEVVPIISEGGGGPLEFDVAVDIGPEGEAVFYPLTLITPGAASRVVGLATSELPFDEILSAPRVDYESDAPVTRDEGEVLLIESFSDACRFQASGRGTNYYGKLVVDSIRPALEKVFVRVTSDPNCGFRSFREGIPGS
jgi:hypothetical protein